MNLSTRISVSLVAGILFGAILNLFFKDFAMPLDKYLLAPVGKAFIRLIQFVVVPIVFTYLILSLTKVQNRAKVGRYTSKLVLLYVVTSLLALAIGLGVAAFLQPGANVTGLNLTVKAPNAQAGQSLIDWLVSLIPTNPFESLSTANLLQIIVSALLIGVAVRLIGEHANPFLALVESINAITEKIMELILRFAPIGVFALISSVIATQGFDLVAKLIWYVLGLLLSIAVMVAVYALILSIVKVKPAHFFKSFYPAFSLAFGTASSNAALPVALENAEKQFQMKQELASFAIPFGTAVKRDAAAILQGFNALFIAQLFHVNLTPAMILAIIISTLLVSFSTAGVPGAGIIMMTTVLSAAGLPLEGIAIVAGVDRLTDGFRTALNVIGNTANAAILNQWERE